MLPAHLNFNSLSANKVRTDGPRARSWDLLYRETVCKSRQAAMTRQQMQLTNTDTR